MTTSTQDSNRWKGMRLPGNPGKRRRTLHFLTATHRSWNHQQAQTKSTPGKACLSSQRTNPSQTKEWPIGRIPFWQYLSYSNQTPMGTPLHTPHPTFTAGAKWKADLSPITTLQMEVALRIFPLGRCQRVPGVSWPPPHSA